MVMIAGNNNDGIDFSFMPSLECDLQCPHCMYDAGYKNTENIDLKQLKKFIRTIPFNMINSFGFYGGEPSINIPLYKTVMKMLPTVVPKWTITNGTWTKYIEPRTDFMNFVDKFNLKVFISSTPYHTAAQDRRILSILRNYRDNYIVKKDDTLNKLLPMGRNSKDVWECTQKCKTMAGPERYAVMPNGDVIFQSCDGVYPVVGDYTQTFAEIITTEIKCDRLGDI